MAVRSKAKATAQTQVPAGIDLADVLAEVNKGKSYEAVLQDLRQKQLREEALNSFGLIKVRINSGVEIRQRKGMPYTIGTLIGVENVKIQTQNKVWEVDEARFAKIQGMEVEVRFDEGAKQQTQAYRDNVAGSLVFEFVLRDMPEFIKLKENLLDENSGDKFQLRVPVSGYVGVEAAPMPMTEVPEEEEEFEAFLSEAGAQSRRIVEAGLNKWRENQQMATSAATEEAIASELEAQAKAESKVEA